MTLGILGLALPPLVNYVMTLPSIFLTSILIPFPLVFVLGLAIIHFLEPVDVDELAGEQILFQETETTMKIPLFYLLRSKIGRSGTSKTDAIRDEEHE